MYYDFFAGAAEDEHTLRENVEAFSRIIIRPTVLVDVSQIDMSVNILGHRISAPIIIAPTAFHILAHPQGEVATAKAAASCKTIMVLSISSMVSLEEVASSCDAVRLFHLCVFKDRQVSSWLVKRAEVSGYQAIVLSVDTPRLGRREDDTRNKMMTPKLKTKAVAVSSEVKPMLVSMIRISFIVKGRRFRSRSFL